ncbi:siderophore-interacting family protein [Anopheles sinensis]|uniref:Siderophore-interacting family protein n=1 Tax=Anopheles sinensis TaxID=74873 RepID=A0A084VVD2_ANOSI|nr:siderophore-interacting family protein [Anopheles sinensis]
MHTFAWSTAHDPGRKTREGGCRGTHVFFHPLSQDRYLQIGSSSTLQSTKNSTSERASGKQTIITECPSNSAKLALPPEESPGDAADGLIARWLHRKRNHTYPLLTRAHTHTRRNVIKP